MDQSEDVVRTAEGTRHQLAIEETSMVDFEEASMNTQPPDILAEIDTEDGIDEVKKGIWYNPEHNNELNLELTILGTY